MENEKTCWWTVDRKSISLYAPDHIKENWKKMKLKEYEDWLFQCTEMCGKPATHIYQNRYVCSFHTKLINRQNDKIEKRCGVKMERPTPITEV